MKTLSQTTRGPIRFGETADDGSKLLYVLPNNSEALQCIGRLMPDTPAPKTVPYHPIFSPAIEDGLHKAIADIGAGLDNTSWSPDFHVQDEGAIFIFWPDSDAALEWCYEKLPEDCPRWGLNGFVIEHNYIDQIIAGAERDGLVNQDAANLEQEQQEWWAQEDQDEQYVAEMSGADVEVT